MASCRYLLIWAEQYAQNFVFGVSTTVEMKLRSGQMVLLLNDFDRIQHRLRYRDQLSLCSSFASCPHTFLFLLISFSISSLPTVSYLQHLISYLTSSSACSQTSVAWKLPRHYLAVEASTLATSTTTTIEERCDDILRRPWRLCRCHGACRHIQITAPHRWT